MGQFSEMEWNSKWDWENLVMCGSKSIESPKKLHLADWMIVDDGETDAGSFNLSAGFGNSGVSGSDSGCVYSAKSSVSASTDSSTKDGMQTPSFRLMSLEGFSKNLGEKMDASRTFPHMDSSIGSGEQSIGLKLGKRTYFNNSSGGGNLKNPSFPVISTPSTISVKKTKSSSPVLPRCVVEGCNFDLSTAKDYHRKHRVCESHAKYPKVVVGGLERRFCQQCSRFHSLDEFDEKKRSCRKRLSDHNARRRKPKQETVQFDSTRLSSPFYEGRQQQMSFLSNTASLINFRIPASAPWMSSYNSKFTLTKECSLKTNEDDEGTDTQMRMPGIKLPQFPNVQQDNPTNGFSASKKSPLEVLPGSDGSLISSHVDAAGPECSRALSLLSTNLWGEPESIPIQKYPIPEENGNTLVTATTAAQRTMNTIPLLLSSSGLWHQSTHHLRIQSSSSSSMAGTKSISFQEMQLLKTPYEGDLFSNMLN